MRQVLWLSFIFLIGCMDVARANLEVVGQSDVGLNVRTVLSGQSYLGTIANEHLGKSQIFVYRIENVEHKSLLVYSSDSIVPHFFECPRLNNRANCSLLKEKLLQKWNLGQLGDDPETLNGIESLESVAIQPLVMSEQSTQTKETPQVLQCSLIHPIYRHVEWFDYEIQLVDRFASEQELLNKGSTIPGRISGIYYKAIGPANALDRLWIIHTLGKYQTQAFDAKKISEEMISDQVVRDYLQEIKPLQPKPFQVIYKVKNSPDSIFTWDDWYSEIVYLGCYY